MRKSYISILANRTDGRTMLQCCLRLSVVCNVCVVAKRKRCVLTKKRLKKQIEKELNGHLTDDVT